MDDIDKVIWIIFIGTLVANFLLNTGRVQKAIVLCKECLILLNIYTSKIEFASKLLVSLRGCGVEALEGTVTLQLAKLYCNQSKYKEAKELFKKALDIMIEIGDRKGQAACYGILGAVYQSLGQYGKVEEYQKKALVIRKEIGDKKGEAASYGNLGRVYQSRGLHGKAKEYQKKALAIRKEIGDKKGEAACHGNLGTVY